MYLVCTYTNSSVGRNFTTKKVRFLWPNCFMLTIKIFDLDLLVTPQTFPFGKTRKNIKFCFS